MLLSDYHPDVEMKFRQFITARCREWVAEMMQMPEFERWRASSTSMRAMGIEPSPELLATEARIRFLAARELERRGMGHLIPRVH
ncbi:hypothetical protein [Mesorhizobium amorphae]|nr:hypothetical protein [Mesorhizobium amorphae]